jgi:hypothetical protein
MRAYEESKVDSAGVQEIYTDLASQYRARVRLGNNVAVAGVGITGNLSNKAVYFEPKGGLSKRKQEPPSSSSGFKSFNAYFDPVSETNVV